LSKIRLLPAQPNIGDELKSWDVLRTANFAIDNLNPADAVLDIGAFASEVLIVLHRAGFSNLTGADLNPLLRSMPYSDKIRYEVTDFLKTPFGAGSFSMVTAISVIEHGYQPDRLLGEMSRLLKPNGFFVASFDYWPEKIATDGIQMFGMDWRIFSEQDVHDLIGKAAAHGLTPYGAVDLKAKERPISCLDRHYTFAWIALRKTA
jgi:SAM-dependent methyltransferase